MIKLEHMFDQKYMNNFYRRVIKFIKKDVRKYSISNQSAIQTQDLHILLAAPKEIITIGSKKVHTSWCGHCKQMKPDFIQAADDLIDDSAKLAGSD